MNDDFLMWSRSAKVKKKK